MGNLLTPLDIAIFFASLVAVMGLGLWAGRKEDTSADYFLAGRTARWWGVAGSIFGSNVSANHIIGMMGVGFSAGFAQSHFEISAIFGLLLLCYGFLPVYRRLNVFTLSEYLSRRYDDRSRVAYALIMLLVIVVIQMVPGYYIGSRSLNILFQSGETATARAVLDEDGRIEKIEVLNPGEGYARAPAIDLFDEDGVAESDLAAAKISDGRLESITLAPSEDQYDPDNPPRVVIRGGAEFDPELDPGDVNPDWYIVGIILMAVVTGTYTIIGGLKAVIVTDVLQSIMMLAAGLIVAVLTFNQPEIGGWAGMRALDAANPRGGLMHLYLPADHPQLPWTGVLSGLMILHFYYWGTNQFIVQRALAARDNRQARLGIVTAGFFKLLIPFISIGTGIAAYYLFAQRGLNVDQDAAFPELMKRVVAPLGFGIVGLVAAGLIGAILSSIDSMMNSAATVITFDFYQRYIDPQASEKRLILVGRIWIAVFIVAAALLTIFTMDPNSEASFFLHIASHQSKLIAGVVVAFALGMFWKRATAAGAIAAIVVGVAVSYGAPVVYQQYAADVPALLGTFGNELNFMHSVFLAAVMALAVHVLISLLTAPDPEKSKLTWTDLGGHDPRTVRRAAAALGVSLLLYGVLAVLMVQKLVSPLAAGLAAAFWTWSLFIVAARAAAAKSTGGDGSEGLTAITNDRFWAGLLAAVAIFMMFYYY